MPSERFFVHKEDGSLVRLKGRLVRFLDEEPPTGSDKSAIRTALEVSPDAEGLVQADVGTDPNQLVLHQHLGDISYQSSDSVSVDDLEVTGKLDIDSSGNVSIGAGDVANNGSLHVYRSSATADLNLQSAGGSGRSYALQSKADGNLVIRDNNAAADRCTIDSSGRVGIGTTSPDQLIHASSSTGASLRLERDSVTITSGQSYGAVEWEGQDASGGGAASGVRAKIETEATSTSGAVALKFYTAAGNDVATERWRIDSSGNLVANSTGIDFGSTNSTSGVTVTGSTLDHYEAGTWTPTVGFITAGPTPGASAAYSGRYTRIGRMVYCSIDLDFDNAATSIAVDDRWTMTGLPFSVASELQTYTGAGSFIVYGSVASGVNALGTVGISQTSDTVLFYVTHLDGTLGYDYNVRAIFSYETDA